MGIPQMCSNMCTLYNFADWLKSVLSENNISVVKLAKISGVHPNTIHNYLAERCEPSLFNVQCITNALGYELAVKLRDNK